MGSRFELPDTKRIDISQGDWLLVKKRLTAGEQRRIFARIVKTQKAGEKIELDPVQASLAQMTEYLLDWSLTDHAGKPVIIRQQPPDVVAAALDSLDIDSFNEIFQAITAHEAAMQLEREEEKKPQAGTSEQPQTSASAA